MTVALIDFQERLVPAIAEHERMIAAAAKLAAAAHLLERQVIATEQVPAKLGRTVPQIPTGAVAPIEKTGFDASSQLLDAAEGPWVIAGCEAHICVRQTVRGLIARGQKVVVVVDAIGSRHALDKEIAVRDMASMGARLSTVESVLFDWIGGADHPRFREISNLIK